jgi:tRNA threonylcarbamoyladenosine biosynthesis protein TsaE
MTSANPVLRAWHDTLSTTSDTARLGQALARYLTAAPLEEPWVIALDGDLGVGKTALVRFLLRAAGVQGTIRSPSYTLLEPYSHSRLNFYHFDFYRFTHPEVFLERGFDDYVVPGAVCLIEWPDKAGAFLPSPDLRIGLAYPTLGERLDPDDECSSRSVSLQALTEKGRSCLMAIQTAWLAPSDDTSSRPA